MRTIIDLPEEQLNRLADICKDEGISRAEAIRQAVQQMIDEKRKVTRDKAIAAVFGIWKDRKDIGDSVEYVRNLRKEWDREWDE